MKNRELSCKQFKVLVLIGVISLMVINGLILQVPRGVFYRTLGELILIAFIAIYVYCKKLKGNET